MLTRELMATALRRARRSFEIGAITAEEYQEAITQLGENEGIHVGDFLEAIRRIREDEDMDAGAIIVHPGTPVPTDVIGIYEGDGCVRLGRLRHLEDAIGEAIDHPPPVFTEALPEREGGFGTVSMLYDEFGPFPQIFRGSVAYRGPIMASTCFAPIMGTGFADHLQHREFRSFRKVTDEAEKKAWALLEKFMTPDQYFAFMEGSTIELENGDGRYRLLINRIGKFRMLQGKRGAGIEVTSGIIRRYKYPLGDEIAAFLDWFNHRTDKLIAQWNCGTFSLVPDGRAR